jgi:hypothetical protein
MTLDELPDYVSADDLEPIEITPEDVRRRRRGAVELVALDGLPCWPRDDLASLFEAEKERDGR